MFKEVRVQAGRDRDRGLMLLRDTHPLDVRLGLHKRLLVLVLGQDEVFSSLGVLYKLHGLDGLGDVEEPHGLSHAETEKVGVVVLVSEVGAVNVEGVCKGEGVGAHGGVFGLVGHFQELQVGVGQVGYLDSDGVQNHHVPGGDLVQVVADVALESLDWDDGVAGGDANVSHKGIDGLWSEAPPPDGGEGVESRVVPARDDALVDEFVEFSLGEDGVGQVESAVLPLDGLVDLEGIHKPVVGLSGHDKLCCAEGVGDVFKGVAEAVGVVVGGVDAPLVSRSHVA